jgi:hypothetical protein
MVLSHILHYTILRAFAYLHATIVKAGLAAHLTFITRLLTLYSAMAGDGDGNFSNESISSARNREGEEIARQELGLWILSRE